MLSQKVAKIVDRKLHAVIESAHPSPLSGMQLRCVVLAPSQSQAAGRAASKGFFGSKPFSRANALLRKWGTPEINWGDTEGDAGRAGAGAGAVAVAGAVAGAGAGPATATATATAGALAAVGVVGADQPLPANRPTHDDDGGGRPAKRQRTAGRPATGALTGLALAISHTQPRRTIMQLLGPLDSLTLCWTPTTRPFMIGDALWQVWEERVVAANRGRRIQGGCSRRRVTLFSACPQWQRTFTCYNCGCTCSHGFKTGPHAQAIPVPRGACGWSICRWCDEPGTMFHLANRQAMHETFRLPFRLLDALPYIEGMRVGSSTISRMLLVADCRALADKVFGGPPGAGTSDGLNAWRRRCLDSARKDGPAGEYVMPVLVLPQLYQPVPVAEALRLRLANRAKSGKAE